MPNKVGTSMIKPKAKAIPEKRTALEYISEVVHAPPPKKAEPTVKIKVDPPRDETTLAQALFHLSGVELDPSDKDWTELNAIYCRMSPYDREAIVRIIDHLNVLSE